MTEEVHYQMSKRYKDKRILDEIERAILDIIDRDTFFDCSVDGIGDKIFGKEDHENPILGLHVGVMPMVNSGCLNIFASKISNVIYRNGNKDLIFEIMCSLIVTEMKTRFSKSKEYIFVGDSTSKNQGTIKKR